MKNLSTAYSLVFILATALLATGCGNTKATVSTDEVPANNQFISTGAQAGQSGSSGAGSAPSTNTTTLTLTLLNGITGNYVGKFYDDTTEVLQPFNFKIELKTATDSGQKFYYFTLTSAAVPGSQLGAISKAGYLAIANTNGSTQIELVTQPLAGFFNYEPRYVGLDMILNLVSHSAGYSVYANMLLKDCTVQGSTQCIGNHADVSVTEFYKTK